VNVVCIGDCGIDHYIDSSERRVGGISANFALRARQCFSPLDRIQLIAPLGDDADADAVRERFADSGIEDRFTVIPGATPIQSIEIDSDGERHFVGYAEGVLDRFRIEGEDAAYVRCADLVVAPVFAQNREMFASVMKAERQGMTAVDFADFSQHPDFDYLHQYIDQIDLGFFGLSAAQEDTIESLRLLSAKHHALLIVTLGANGSLALRDGHMLECAAQPVRQVIDTTGAGDAFAAGFLGHYCQSSDIDSALKAAAVVAAQAVQQHGAV